MRSFPSALLLLAACLATAQAVGAPSPAPGTYAAQVPVDRAVVERAAEQLLATWNVPGFAGQLAPDFPNRERLLSALAALPITAELKLVGLGGIQTLEQSRVDGALVSLVSATARVVLRYQDAGGFQRREGSFELILRLTRQAPR